MTNVVERNARSKTLSGVKWAALEACSVLISSLVVFILVGRILGPEAAGLAAIVVSVVQLFQIFIESIFQDAIIQKQTDDEYFASSVLNISIILSTLLFFTIIITPNEFIDNLMGGEYSLYIKVSSLALFANSVSGVYTAVMRKHFLYKKLAIRTTICRLTGSVIAIASLVCGAHIWSLIIQHIATSYLLMLAAIFSYRLKYSIKIDLKSSLSLFKFSLSSSISNLILQSNLRIFMIVTASLIGAAGVGYLSAAFRIVDSARSLITSTLQQITMPAFSARNHDPIAMRKGFIEATELTTFLTVPLFCGLAGISQPLIELLMGPKWGEAAILTSLLSLGSVVHLMRLPASSLIVAGGRPQMMLLQNGIGLITSLGLLVAFGKYGVVAAALIWLVRAIVAFPVSLVSVYKTNQISYLDQLRPLLPTAISAVSMSVAVAIALKILEEQSVVLQLALSVPTGAAVYITCYFLLFRSKFNTIYATLLQVIKIKKS